MSPLTKALVVILTLLIPVHAAILVPFVAKTENAKSDKAELRTELSQAKGQLSLSKALLAEARSQVASATTLGSGELQDANDKIATLQSQLRSAQAQATKAEANVTTLTAKVGEMEQSLAQNSTIAEESLSSADGLRRELAEAQTRRREVENRLESALAEGEQATESANYYKEMYVKLQAQVARGDSSTNSATLTNAVEGKVTEVVDRNGQVFVQIDLGSADGLVQGVELIVVRDELVGLVTITEVSNNSAVARFDSMKLVPSVGDSVISG